MEKHYHGILSMSKMVSRQSHVDVLVLRPTLFKSFMMSQDMAPEIPTAIGKKSPSHRIEYFSHLRLKFASFPGFLANSSMLITPVDPDDCDVILYLPSAAVHSAGSNTEDIDAEIGSF